MSDMDGLEELGGLARWREVVLRFPGGSTQPYRLVELDGRLPFDFRRPLNDARITYERFELAESHSEPPIYDWADIEER